MTNVKPPPIYEPLFEAPEQLDPKPSVPWILFFQQLFNGDTGTKWNPNFVNLTQVGTPTITGRVYQISKSIAYFAVKIVPGTNTSSTAGTTYIDNFPFRMRGDGVNFAVSGLLGTNAGQCEQATNRIYVPTWSAVTIPLTVVGMVEAS